ncbi:MAG TPA: dephospho-CoA kinase [Gemmatimonadales bacterium]|nr:dephospho-CoA kinase [Gemmatimonadales bacterium]
MTRVVGLTGNIASGKSSVAAILRRHGIPVIDADAIVHELQRPGTAVFRAIIARFGDEILTADGSIDRRRLRQRILDSDEDRLALEAIVHPAVFEHRGALLRAATETGTSLVVVDVPLLYEVDDPRHYDAVILVDAPRAERWRRLVEDRGMPPAEADRLIDLQLPADSKRERADFVIDNDGTWARLEQQTADVLAQLAP